MNEGKEERAAIGRGELIPSGVMSHADWGVELRLHALGSLPLLRLSGKGERFPVVSGSISIGLAEEYLMKTQRVYETRAWRSMLGLLVGCGGLVAGLIEMGVAAETPAESSLKNDVSRPMEIRSPTPNEPRSSASGNNSRGRGPAL